MDRWEGPFLLHYNYSTTKHKKEANLVHREAEHEGHITKKQGWKQEKKDKGMDDGQTN